MAIYKIRLKGCEEVALGTMAVHFEKPEGFTYKAGQYGDITIANPPETDAEGNTRGFSFASAPYETDLMMATRMRDTAFKRVLKKMEIGSELSLDAPYGSFTLHSDVRIPAAFLSGGHRHHSRSEHYPPSYPRQDGPPDLPLRFKSNTRGFRVFGRFDGGAEGKPKFHLRRYDDGDG